MSFLARLGGLTPSGKARVAASWALYDFANTIFSFAVVSSAIGLWLVSDDRFGERDGNFILSVAVVASVGLNALVSPILGALSDRGGRRLPYLFAFTALCIVPTAFIGASSPMLGVALFVIANFGYQAALIYYDATLKSVSKPQTRGRLSGIGVGIGYLGTIFSGLVMLILGISVDDRFLVAAILFAVFAIPIFVFVRESGSVGRVTVSDVFGSLAQCVTTVRHAREVPGLDRFLVARFFYSDAVNTVIVVMSVVTTKAMGMTDSQALMVLLGLTVVAIFASFWWGRLVDRLGPRRTLMIVLTSWAVGLVLGAVSIGIGGTLGIALFLIAGAILGSGLGGVQVADRVLMVRLSPPERVGEFFGLYGLVGKGSQVVGQLLYGLTLLVFFDTLGIGAYQLAVLTLLITMVVGAWLLRPVRDHWIGAGEVDVHAPPDRLAPAVAPMDPR
ncbi:MAG TPA: MFS transporter [Candidatus Limnocylindrales bacterium]|nr:MFS transporter [Candidatus Limnocylindrales bacterium]